MRWMGRSGVVERELGRGSDDGLSGVLDVREGGMIDCVLRGLSIEGLICDCISWSEL